MHDDTDNDETTVEHAPSGADGRSRRELLDDRIVAALAAGCAQPQAAAAAHTSERTIRRRMEDPTFASRVAEATAGTTRRLAEALAPAQLTAITVLQDAMTSERVSDQIKAAVALLTHGLRVRQAADLEQWIIEQRAAIAHVNRRLDDLGGTSPADPDD